MRRKSSVSLANTVAPTYDAEPPAGKREGHAESRGPSSSPFADRLHRMIDRWAARLPLDLQQAFRREFSPFADEYDRTLDTIQTIWHRREQEYAFDQSTGLARRRHFFQHLVTLLGVPATPLFGAVGVLFIDLDNLKGINDTCGHSAGDRAIRAAAAILRDAVRVSRHVDRVDHLGHGDSEYAVSRHGGDEFLVVLELGGATDIDVVAPRLKRNLDDVEQQRAHGYESPERLTASIGGVAYELRDTPASISPQALAKDLVSAADQLMYASKRDGLIHLAVARYLDRLSIEHRYVREPGVRAEVQRAESVTRQSGGLAVREFPYSRSGDA